jgi:uncharacterized protein YyaL (SSP411 family)
MENDRAEVENTAARSSHLQAQSLSANNGPTAAPHRPHRDRQKPWLNPTIGATAAGAQRPNFPNRWRSISSFGTTSAKTTKLKLIVHCAAAMARGGMYDVVGGGFSRYSVDNFWRVPHFEKMLYDNAQLVRAYLHAWQVTDESFFRQIVMET